jgi:hypothetical protein
MVSWLHVVEAWKSKAVTLPPISIYEEKGSVDLFKLPVLSTTVEKPIVKPVVKPVVNRTEKICGFIFWVNNERLHRLFI